MNMDKCIARQIGERNCFVCVLDEQDRDNCPYAKEHGLFQVLCSHPKLQAFHYENPSDDDPQQLPDIANISRMN